MTFSLNRRTLIASVFAAATVFSPFAAQAQEPNPDTLRVALLPDENAATLIQNAQPLKEYLSKTSTRMSRSSSRPTIPP